MRPMGHGSRPLGNVCEPMTGIDTKIRITKDDQQTATEEQACNSWGTVVVRWGIVPTPKQVWGRHTIPLAPLVPPLGRPWDGSTLGVRRAS